MRQSAKKIILFLLLFSCTMLHAAERYSVRVLEQGNMYFFMPYKMKGNSGCHLQYDMTVLSFRDSVGINMTLTSPLGRVQSIRLASGGTDYSTTQYELYFQERNGPRFDTRVHIDCPIEIYKQLFTSDTPLAIEITMENGERYAFIHKAKKWKKETVFVSEVLEMIAYGNSRL